MPNLCRQISEPGAAAMGEAWMAICRRLRLELGEDVFSSWFGCLELDALSDEDASLSVPTKFLKCWIQSYYTDKILQALASEFPTIKRVSISVRSSTRPAPPRATGGHLDPTPCGDADPVSGRNVTSLGSSPPMVAFGVTMPSSKKTASMEGCDAETLSGSPLDRRLIFSNFLVGASNQLAHAAAQRIAFATAADPFAFQSALSPCFSGIGQDPPSASRRACFDLDQAQGHLPHRRAIHVWFRRRPQSADRDRLQGNAAGHRSSCD